MRTEKLSDYRLLSSYMLLIALLLLSSGFVDSAYAQQPPTPYDVSTGYDCIGNELSPLASQINPFGLYNAPSRHVYMWLIQNNIDPGYYTMRIKGDKNYVSTQTYGSERFNFKQNDTSFRIDFGGERGSTTIVLNKYGYPDTPLIKFSCKKRD